MRVDSDDTEVDLIDSFAEHASNELKESEMTVL